MYVSEETACERRHWPVAGAVSGGRDGHPWPHVPSRRVRRIQLASNLSIGTIAEGVERPDQLDYLRRNGCQWAQGFHFARPLDARWRGS